MPNDEVRLLYRHGLEAALYKPPGLSSERTGATGRGGGDSLAARACRLLGWSDCLLPHRLDRPTRGIMMVAGSSAQVALHSAEIRSGAWTKWYAARVPGRGRDGATPGLLLGLHKAYLRREGRRAVVVRSGGDPSRLAVLAEGPAGEPMPGLAGATPSDRMVLIRLDTGRFHQIRVMLAHLGFPLVGDTEYGAPGPATPSGACIDLEAVALHIRRDGIQHGSPDGKEGCVEDQLAAPREAPRETPEGRSQNLVLRSPGAESLDGELKRSLESEISRVDAVR